MTARRASRPFGRGPLLRFRYVGLILIGILVSRSSAASSEGLVSMLSTNSVEIASNYTGAEIAVFGVVERDGATVSRATPYEVVITVAGPSLPLVVRQKARLGFIWVNREQWKFSEVPGFYALMSSSRLTDIVGESSRRRLRIGTAVIAGPPEVDEAVAPSLTIGPSAPFEHALVRLREREGLFRQVENSVVFSRANVFSARLSLPAHAPLGRYLVTSYLFSGGVLLASGTSGFYVRKIGFEAAMTSAARTKPLLYGLSVAGMALVLGWFASLVFRRD